MITFKNQVKNFFEHWYKNNVPSTAGRIPRGPVHMWGAGGAGPPGSGSDRGMNTAPPPPGLAVARDTPRAEGTDTHPDGLSQQREADGETPPGACRGQDTNRCEVSRPTATCHEPEEGGWLFRGLITGGESHTVALGSGHLGRCPACRGILALRQIPSVTIPRTKSDSGSSSA